MRLVHGLDHRVDQAASSPSRSVTSRASLAEHRVTEHADGERVHQPGYQWPSAIRRVALHVLGGQTRCGSTSTRSRPWARAGVRSVAASTSASACGDAARSSAAAVDGAEHLEVTAEEHSRWRRRRRPRRGRRDRRTEGRRGRRRRSRCRRRRRAWGRRCGPRRAPRGRARGSGPGSRDPDRRSPQRRARRGRRSHRACSSARNRGARSSWSKSRNATEPTGRPRRESTVQRGFGADDDVGGVVGGHSPFGDADPGLAGGARRGRRGAASPRGERHAGPRRRTRRRRRAGARRRGGSARPPSVSAIAAPQCSQRAGAPHWRQIEQPGPSPPVQDAHARRSPRGRCAARWRAARRAAPARAARRAGRPPRRAASRRAGRASGARVVAALEHDGVDGRRRRRRSSAPRRPGGPARGRRHGRARWVRSPRRGLRRRRRERRSPARSGTGANTATRPPIDDARRRGGPRATLRCARRRASSPCSSTTARPVARAAGARRRCSARSGTTTIVEPSGARRESTRSARSPGRGPDDEAGPGPVGQRQGGRRRAGWTARSGSGRGAGSTTLGGDAARRNVAHGPAQRHAAHRTARRRRAGGPAETTAWTGRSGGRGRRCRRRPRRASPAPAGRAAGRARWCRRAPGPRRGPGSRRPGRWPGTSGRTRHTAPVTGRGGSGEGLGGAARRSSACSVRSQVNVAARVGRSARTRRCAGRSAGAGSGSR